MKSDFLQTRHKVEKSIFYFNSLLGFSTSQTPGIESSRRMQGWETLHLLRGGISALHEDGLGSLVTTAQQGLSYLWVELFLFYEPLHNTSGNGPSPSWCHFL